MALSHPCPASLSQLNEPFPRQIKTGESAFTRGRRLRKAIQTGMEGDRATVSAAEGHEEKGKAGAGREAQGARGEVNCIYPLYSACSREGRPQQQIGGIRDVQEMRGRRERRRLTGR